MERAGNRAGFTAVSSHEDSALNSVRFLAGGAASASPGWRITPPDPRVIRSFSDRAAKRGGIFPRFANTSFNRVTGINLR